MKEFIIISLLMFQAGCAAESTDPLKFNDALVNIDSGVNTDVDTHQTAGPALAGGVENTGWQLSHFLDATGKETPVLPGTAINVLFSNNKLTGHGGCNRYFGNYQITAADNRLSLTGPIGATKMSCRPPINEQEQVYFNRLSQTAYYQLAGQSLTLLNQNRQALLKFKSATAATLENTIWQTIISPSYGSVTSGKNTHLATACFVNGELSGKAGCNQYSADYTVKDQQLIIGQIRSTQIACPGPGMMEQESRYLQALSQAGQYQITAGQLKLLDSNGLVIISFTKQQKC